MTELSISTEGSATSPAVVAGSVMSPSTGSQIATQVTTQAVAETPSWLNGADDTTVGYVQNKGWKDPIQMLDGYRNLEKLLGADKANNAIIIPKDTADAKEWNAVYDRLGRPSAPDGYKVEIPQGGDKDFHDASMAKFYELGLNKMQGEKLANWYNDTILKEIKEREVKNEQVFQQEDSEVKREWGQAYTQNLAQTQVAVRGLGLSADMVDKISSAIGHKATMNLFQKIGAGMREDTLVGSGSGFGSILTPGQAKAEIQRLVQDKDFSKKYLNGDADSLNRMKILHEYAYPEEEK